jgi:hypothetical protein
MLARSLGRMLSGELQGSAAAGSAGAGYRPGRCLVLERCRDGALLLPADLTGGHSRTMSVLLPTVPQTRMLRMSSPASARRRWSRRHSSIVLQQPGPRNRKTRFWPLQRQCGAVTAEPQPANRQPPRSPSRALAIGARLGPNKLLCHTAIHASPLPKGCGASILALGIHAAAG